LFRDSGDAGESRRQLTVLNRKLASDAEHSNEWPYQTDQIIALGRDES
jgi:hypothetical protein